MIDDQVPDDSGAAEPRPREAGAGTDADPAPPWPEADPAPPWPEADPAPRPRGAAATQDGDPVPPPWAGAARPRGLDAYFAPGGEDDAPPARVADERRMLRLLALMVALLIGIPTLLTLIAVAAQLVAARSGG